jgi:tRNA pseudouridine38-40 synthase
VTRTFRLTLEYDGAGFEGWQLQPRGRTLQGEIESAFARICGEPVHVEAAGRTDSGVHAEGQVASVRLDTDADPHRLQRALNGVLPSDMAVIGLEPVPEGFHARKHARSKLYRYQIWNGPDRSPLREARCLCLQRPLDLKALRRAAQDLVGAHDFASFQAAGSSVSTTERTLLRLDVRGEPGGRIDLEFEGTGFLRHMVRILVGTLLQVASGRRDPESMPGLLAARRRADAGPTAPAHALTLVRVIYPDLESRGGRGTGPSRESLDRSGG